MSGFTASEMVCIVIIILGCVAVLLFAALRVLDNNRVRRSKPSAGERE